jgi:hypothetical protein
MEAHNGAEDGHSGALEAVLWSRKIFLFAPKPGSCRYEFRLRLQLRPWIVLYSVVDPDPLVRAWIRGSGSGSTPKCHRSATLVLQDTLKITTGGPGRIFWVKSVPFHKLLWIVIASQARATGVLFNHRLTFFY